MFRYIRTRQPSFQAQGLILYYDKVPYFPVIQHAAIDQDRPVGDRKTFREHYHELYHIVVYTKSQGKFSKNGRFFTAKPGTVVFVSPGQPHDFVTRRGSAVYSEITFSLETQRNQCLTVSFEELLSVYTGTKISLQEDARIMDTNQIKEFQIHLIQLSDFLESHSPLAEFHAQRSLAQIFNFLITNCCKIDKRDSTASNSLIPIKQYIDTHYAEPIRMDELAEMAHISKGHLFRTFKKTFGFSPVVYQQNLRIEAAKTMLRSSSLKCNEISQRVGYENIYFFYRIFKKIVGIPPKRFRDSFLTDNITDNKNNSGKIPHITIVQ